jgi:hypothetical protein
LARELECEALVRAHLIVGGESAAPYCAGERRFGIIREKERAEK